MIRPDGLKVTKQQTNKVKMVNTYRVIFGFVLAVYVYTGRTERR